MIGDKFLSTRSSRIAVLSSIEARRASLEFPRSKLENIQKPNTNNRSQSIGKIVKNGPQLNKNYNVQPLKTSSKKAMAPLYDKINILEQTTSNQLLRKTPTPSFGYFEEFDNSKAKKIQEKYKAMLMDYDNKKKAIYSQLNSLKSSTQLKNESKYNRYQNENINHLIGPKTQKDSSYYDYQTRTKQLIVEKLGMNSQLKVRKKEKITDIYPQFFKALRNQIALEQQFRNLRGVVNPEHKQEIQCIINENSELKGKNILEMDPEEFDPFELKTASNLPVPMQATKIIQRYQQCQQNWRNKVCTLKPNQAKQIFSALNFQKSQQISIKSFVREVSYLLEKHYRNRDLFRIFIRLSPLTQHNFCTVTSQKC